MEVAPEDLQVRADGLGVRDQPLRRIRVSEDRGAPRAVDPRFLEADGFTVVAEVRLVVEVDAHDRGHIRIDDVHGVQPAPEAHFEDDGVELRAAEDVERAERAVLEVREGRRSAGRFHALERFDEHLVGDFLALHANTLVVAKQVGRCVEADAISGFEEDAFEDGAGGALAVGPPDRDYHG